MEFRQLGASGLKVPVLSFGTGTFGGGNELFKAWGSSDVAEATRLVDVCLEAGLNLFDSADIYSQGMAEEILGQAIKGRRDKVLISTKGTFRSGPGPNDVRFVAAASDPGRRGQSEAAGHGLHRPLPAARLRCADTRRRSAGRARRSGARGQDPLYRLFKFFGLASDEVTVGIGKIRLVSLRRTPGVLLPGQPRIRMGTDAAGAGSKSQRSHLEPAGLGAADGQDSARATSCPRAAGSRANSPRTSDRRFRTSMFLKSSTPSTTWRKKPEKRCRKSR